ncbi:hypothetical protein ACQPVA_05880 [Clostridium butyricum]|uniref:hypothetical protein n=1 Tax=Clostridium butyricum TaxID=1492 RepID=UPI003D32B941
MSKNGVKIKSINGAEVLKIQNEELNVRKAEFGKAVFNNSLLLDKLKKLGLDITKQGSTKDIIVVKFDYMYKSEQAKKDEEECIKLKSYTKQLKKYNKDKIKRIKQLHKNIENNEAKLIEENEEDKILKIKNRINKYKDELSNLDLDIIKNIEDNEAIIKNLASKVDKNITKKDIVREQLYKDGFELQTYKTVKKVEKEDKKIKYVFWFRSAGKAKQGEDYFINKKLWNDINEWQTMGIELPKENCKLVEMEAYKSLVASAITGYYTCNPRTEILVVNDLDYYSELQDVIKVIRNKTTGFSEALHTKAKCKNTIWDGMCLIQKEEGFEEGFRGLRHHFYKTGAFIGDFQQYFKDFCTKNGHDYNTYTVIDRYGRELLLKNIKMLTTENAMKWEKLIGASKDSYEKWCDKVEENGCNFGVCKENHVSKYGEKQRMSYQMLNSLPLEDGDIEDIFADSLDYITKLKNDDEFFIEHLNRTASEVNNNELLADLASTYTTFVDSYYFKENRKAEIYIYKESLKQGKLLTEGDNETIVGNPMILLKYVTGQIDDDIKDGVISGCKDTTLPNKNSCYCRRFADGEEIGTFRSPHNSPNNIMVFKNNLSEEMDKYFYCLGDNVIAVNFLENDVQDRGNGLDTDTDFLLCTTNDTIVKACKKAQEYPTIVNGFVLSSKTYNNTIEDLAKIDNGLQASQKAIGTSSNVAMLYLSQYWNMFREHEEKHIDYYLDYNYLFMNNNTCEYLEDKQKEEELLDNVCILSVLAQVSVDSSKRAYEVGKWLKDKKGNFILDKETGKKIIDPNGLRNEIERLRNELPHKEKPTFWQYTNSAFKNEEIEKKLKNRINNWKSLNKKDKNKYIKEEKKRMIAELVNYNCPFNNVLKEIDSKIKDADGRKPIEDAEFLVSHGNRETQDRKQGKKIAELVEEFYNASKFIKITQDEEDEEENNKYYGMLYKEYLDKINKLTISLDTMSLIIIRALDKDNKFLKSNSKIKTKLLNILYKSNRDKFMKCFKDSEK